MRRRSPVSIACTTTRHVPTCHRCAARRRPMGCNVCSSGPTFLIWTRGPSVIEPNRSSPCRHLRTKNWGSSDARLKSCCNSPSTRACCLWHIEILRGVSSSRSRHTSSGGNRMPFEILWKEGTDPRQGKWPGLQRGVIEREGGMLIERDVPVRLRDGVTVYVDIFRPDGAVEELPVILTWSPYGKHGLKTFAMFPNSGVPAASVSRHAG